MAEKLEMIYQIAEGNHDTFLITHQEKPMSDLPQLREAVRLQQTGRVKEACAMCRQMLVADPSNAAVLHVLGQLECQRGRMREAVQAIQRSLQIEPENAEVLTTFGALLSQMGNHKESLKLLEKAFRIDPSIARLHYNFGVTLKNLAKYPVAEKAFRQAIELKPDHAEAHAHLANLLIKQTRFALAVDHSQLAIKYRPHFAYALVQLTQALGEQGRLPELLANRRSLMKLVPKLTVEHSNYLAALFYDGDVSGPEYFTQCREWDLTHGHRAEPPAFSNIIDRNRPLRIAYISSHFSFHIVGRLLLPLLRHHDRSRFSVYCYSAVEKPVPPA